MTPDRYKGGTSSKEIALAALYLFFIVPRDVLVACSQAIGHWLECRASRKDPTPGEMQYLLRIVELWCYEHGWCGNSDRLRGEFYDEHFWSYIDQGEAARVDPAFGYVNGLDMEQAHDHDNIPPNWRQIVKQLRS